MLYLFWVIIVFDIYVLSPPHPLSVASNGMASIAFISQFLKYKVITYCNSYDIVLEKPLVS